MISNKVIINSSCASPDLVGFSKWKNHKIGNLIFSWENGSLIKLTEIFSKADSMYGYDLFKQEVVDYMFCFDNVCDLTSTFWLKCYPNEKICITDSSKVLDSLWFQKILAMIQRFYPEVTFVEKYLCEQDILGLIEKAKEDNFFLDRIFAESVLS